MSGKVKYCIVQRQRRAKIRERRAEEGEYSRGISKGGKIWKKDKLKEAANVKK